MALCLKCVILGEPGTGKSSLGRLLSAGRKAGEAYEATVTDPTSHTQLVFRLAEHRDLPTDLRHVACALLVYDVTEPATYEAVQRKYVPYVSERLDAERSFVMLVGTHAEQRCQRRVEAQVAEEYAASQSLFHMEVSTTLKRNIDLTLKVMRIRATYLLKKRPDTACKPPEIDFAALSDEQESPSLTPQFSERHHFRKHSFEQEEDLLNHCSNFSFPLQEADFNAMQGRKKRYDEALGDPSTVDSNLSFANSVVEDEPEMTELMENRPRKEFTLQGDSLLDSQPKKPVIPLLNISHSPSGSQTERRASTPNDRSREIGGSTDRPITRPALLELVVQLSPDSSSRVLLYEGDSALEVAQRLLGDLEDCEQAAGELALVVEDQVQLYCSQLQSVKRQPAVRHIVSERHLKAQPEVRPVVIDLKRSESERKQRPLEPRRLLFKVKVSVGGRQADVLVREGDDLQAVAHSFAECSGLGADLESQVLELLQHAMGRYHERVR